MESTENNMQIKCWDGSLIENQAYYLYTQLKELQANYRTTVCGVLNYDPSNFREIARKAGRINQTEHKAALELFITQVQAVLKAIPGEHDMQL